MSLPSQSTPWTSGELQVPGGSPDLIFNWSTHIHNICSRARHIVGLQYRTFTAHSNSSSLLQLYVSLVRAYLEYACAMWDLHAKRDINLLEGVQKFALRVCFKQYSSSYEDSLPIANLPALKERTFLKLCTFYRYIIFSHSLVHRPSLNFTLPP